MSGYGSQPFGKGPYPFGFRESQASARVKVPMFLSVTSARDLDPARAVSAVVQKVQLILGSVVGSSLIRLSHGLKVPEFVRSSFQSDMEEEISRALSQLILDEEIEIVSVATEVESSQARVVVKYTDITTGETLEWINENT